MRGSLLINFSEDYNLIAYDGYPFRYEVIVNGEERYLHYMSSANLYSTYLYLNDVCTIRIIKDSNVIINNDLYRVDYTTDEEAGDRGIKQTTITGSTILLNDLIYETTFTATTRGDAYDFEYRNDLEIEVPCYDIGSGYTYSGLSNTPRIFDIKLTNNQVYALGLYNNYNGSSVSGLTVTDFSGLINNSFPNNILSAWPGFIELYNNGKFLVSTFDAGGKLYRYNSDGSRDNSFDVSHSPYLCDGKILSDNKIIIVGFINFVNAVATQNIAKLNDDGSIDNSWPKSGFTINGVNGTGIVYRLSIQDDNKILCIGAFNQYSGISTNNICRLNSDGTFDNTFTSPFNFVNISSLLWASGNIKQLSNGKILVGGYFNYLGQIYTLLRLNSDGSVDPTFNKLTLSDTNNVGLIYFDLYNNGKILYNYGFATKRLDVDGNIDNSFNTISTNYVLGGSAFYNRILYINESIKRIYMGGRFSSVNNVPYLRFVVSDLDGNLEMCTPVISPTPTATPTITSTPTLTPTQTPTSSITPTLSISVSATPSETPTPSATPSETPTPSATPTITPSENLTPSMSPTPSETPTPSITPTNSTTPTPSETPTPSITPTSTITPTSSITPTPSITPTSTITPTPSITNTPSLTPSSSTPATYTIGIYVSIQNTVTINDPLKTYYKIDSGSWTLLNDTFNSTVCTFVGNVTNIPNNSTLYIGFEDTNNVPVGFDATVGNSSTCPGITGGADYCKGTSDWSDTINSNGNRAFTIEAGGGEYLAC